MASSSFGAPLDEVWRGQAGFPQHKEHKQSKEHRRAAQSSKCVSAQSDPLCDLYGRGYGSVIDDVMHARSCIPSANKTYKTQRKCPRAPPSSPRRPPPPPPTARPSPPLSHSSELGGPAEWIHLDNDHKHVPGPSPGSGRIDYYDAAGQGPEGVPSAGPGGNHAIAPFGAWDGGDHDGLFPSSLPPEFAFASRASPGSVPAICSDDDDDFMFCDEDVEEDEEGSAPSTKSEAVTASSHVDHPHQHGDHRLRARAQAAQAEAEAEAEAAATAAAAAVAAAAAARNNATRVDGTTFAADMALYIVSGVILIFLMEQFIQMGARMGSYEF